MGDFLEYLPPHAVASTLFETNNLKLGKILGVFFKRGNHASLSTRREYPPILCCDLGKWLLLGLRYVSCIIKGEAWPCEMSTKDMKISNTI